MALVAVFVRGVHSGAVREVRRTRASLPAPGPVADQGRQGVRV